MNPEDLQHVLVIEYGPGAGIGWHRDKPVFGNVIGVSLLAPCTLRFRRNVRAEVSTTRGSGWVDARSHEVSKQRRQWERFNLLAEPRSAYLLTGAARSEWEHSIASVDELRYSITFRSMQSEPGAVATG
jgi:alkylated DNA repair dioxygenase AlkB